MQEHPTMFLHQAKIFQPQRIGLPEPMHKETAMRSIIVLVALACAIAGCQTDPALNGPNSPAASSDALASADTSVPCQTKIFFEDVDHDGFGNPKNFVSACEKPSNMFVSDSSDCNDNDVAIHPGAPEICDSKDNNCDGLIDNTTTSWWLDHDHDGFGDPKFKQEGACTGSQSWLVNNDLDCNDNDATVLPGMAETCDGKDNNCNGQTDEGVQSVFYKDNDHDGHGDASVKLIVCAAPADATASSDDCNDTDASIYHGAPETCDGKDNNCNGQTDENAMLVFYKDNDADGFGGTESVHACSAPVGATSTTGDCNDMDPKINPGAAEVCNEIDDNCNGQTDEGVQSMFYQDNDHDGFGDAKVSLLACSALSIFVSNKTDCNDADGDIYPGAPETCDGKKNDCLATVLSEPNSLCDDADKLTKDFCTGASGCAYEDEKVTLSCFNPPMYQQTDGYVCSVSYFFGDPTGAGGPFEMIFSKDAVTFLMKDVCSLLKKGSTLRVNAYVWLDFDPAAIWVGGFYTKLIDSFTNTAVAGTPGNVTLSWGGLDFDYALADFPPCNL